MADNSSIESEGILGTGTVPVVKKEPISEDEMEDEADDSPPSPEIVEKAPEVRVKNEPLDEDDTAACSIPGKIKLTVKTTKEKHVVFIDKEASIKTLKEEVSKVYKTPIEQICLIFAGKILKDPDTLTSNNITDGLTLHLVIRATPKCPEPSEASRVNATPFGLNAFGGLMGLSQVGFGSPNFMVMQQQMQRELISNPEFLCQVMDNPFVQSLMSNPECIRQIIQSNPDMQQLIERNPDIGLMLNNPDVLRQTMDVARNPDMLQALMHTTRETAAANSEATGATSENRPESEMNLPNPWGAAAVTENTTPSTTAESTTDTTQTPPTTTTPTSVPGGLFTSPGLQSIMLQMVQNPQLVQEMMSAPYMQTVMEALSANPDMAMQVMINNPVFNNNPQVQEQFKRAFPVMMQQMQNQEYRSFVTNPHALMAMMSIHQGLDQLQQAAPNMFNMFPGQAPYFINPSADPSSTAQNNSDTPMESNAGSQETFSQFMSHMVNSMAQRNMSTTQPPEDRYQGEMLQLQAMGFLNREANLQGKNQIGNRPRGRPKKRKFPNLRNYASLEEKQPGQSNVTNDLEFDLNVQNQIEEIFVQQPEPSNAARPIRTAKAKGMEKMSEVIRTLKESQSQEHNQMQLIKVPRIANKNDDEGNDCLEQD